MNNDDYEVTKSREGYDRMNSYKSSSGIAVPGPSPCIFSRLLFSVVYLFSDRPEFPLSIMSDLSYLAYCA